MGCTRHALAHSIMHARKHALSKSTTHPRYTTQLGVASELVLGRDVETLRPAASAARFATLVTPIRLSLHARCRAMQQ